MHIPEIKAFQNRVPGFATFGPLLAAILLSGVVMYTPATAAGTGADWRASSSVVASGMGLSASWTPYRLDGAFANPALIGSMADTQVVFGLSAESGRTLAGGYLSAGGFEVPVLGGRIAGEGALRRMLPQVRRDATSYETVRPTMCAVGVGYGRTVIDWLLIGASASYLWPTHKSYDEDELEGDFTASLALMASSKIGTFGLVSDIDEAKLRLGAGRVTYPRRTVIGGTINLDSLTGRPIGRIVAEYEALDRADIGHLGFEKSIGLLGVDMAIRGGLAFSEAMHPRHSLGAGLCIDPHGSNLRFNWAWNEDVGAGGNEGHVVSLSFSPVGLIHGGIDLSRRVNTPAVDTEWVSIPHVDSASIIGQYLQAHSDNIRNTIAQELAGHWWDENYIELLPGLRKRAELDSLALDSALVILFRALDYASAEQTDTIRAVLDTLTRVRREQFFAHDYAGCIDAIREAQPQVIRDYRAAQWDVCVPERVTDMIQLGAFELATRYCHFCLACAPEQPDSADLVKRVAFRSGAHMCMLIVGLEHAERQSPVRETRQLHASSSNTSHAEIARLTGECLGTTMNLLRMLYREMIKLSYAQRALAKRLDSCEFTGLALEVLDSSHCWYGDGLVSSIVPLELRIGRELDIDAMEDTRRKALDELGHDPQILDLTPLQIEEYVRMSYPLNVSWITLVRDIQHFLMGNTEWRY